MSLDYDKTILRIVSGISEYIGQCSLKGLVLGISGGIDSAVTAELASRACSETGTKLYGYSLPMETNEPDEIMRACAVGETICDMFENVHLGSAFKAAYDSSPLNTGDKVDRGNAMARYRMMFLYGRARKHQSIVLSTDNYTEYLLGFWTMHGDVGDLAPIQQFWKTEVYEMAEHMTQHSTPEKREALESCITASATDGLGISQTDLDQILPDWKDRHSSSREAYGEVDQKLQFWLERKKTLPPNVFTQDPVFQRNIMTEGKRLSPVVFSRHGIAVPKA